MTQRIKTRVKAQKMMRAKKMITAMTALLMIAMFVTMLSVCSYVEHTYTKEAIACVYDNGVIGFIDNTGHEYQVDNVDNVVCGQRVKLIMNDECTISDIKDDSIRRIKPIDIVMN